MNTDAPVIISKRFKAFSVDELLWLAQDEPNPDFLTEIQTELMLRSIEYKFRMEKCC